MPMIDLAVTKRGSNYRSTSFMACLKELRWTRTEVALCLFTAMCNNNIFCPTLSRENEKLKMVWQNDRFGLTIWLYLDKDEIKYSTKMGEIKSTNYEGAKTLVEYWATFVGQGEPKPSVVGECTGF